MFNISGFMYSVLLHDVMHENMERYKIIQQKNPGMLVRMAKPG